LVTFLDQETDLSLLVLFLLRPLFNLG